MLKKLKFNIYSKNFNKKQKTRNNNLKLIEKIKELTGEEPEFSILSDDEEVN